MQDLIDILSNPPLWKTVQPLVYETFKHIVQLFEKFNNKLAFVEDKMYNKMEKKVDGINKTLFKEKKVKWKSPLKETISSTIPEKLITQGNKNKNKKVKQIVPQQLYLQSNETMFAMIVEEIEKLKIQKQKSSKKTVIHQPILEKLDEKVRELEYQVQTLGLKNSNDVSKNYEQTKYSRQVLQYLQATILGLQAQINNKPSNSQISLLQQQIAGLQNEKQQIQEHMETNLTSINKILQHQAIINGQVCRQMKVGKWMWEGKRKTQMTLVPWQKQIINLLPESIIWNPSTTTLIIKQGGFYQLNLIVVGEGINPSLGILVDNESSLFKKQEGEVRTFSIKYTDIIEVMPGSSLSISSDVQRATIILLIHKII